MQVIAFLGQLGQSRDFSPRNDQDVSWSDGCNIPKRNHKLVLVDDLTGNFAVDDFRE
jgi:hypothetical protein